MAFNEKITEFKLMLHSEIQYKLKLERMVNSLRNQEYILTEEIAMNKVEREEFLLKINELSREISQMKCQKVIIDICSESEKSKIDVQLSTLEKHKNGYDVFFDKERAVSEIKNDLIRQKEIEIQELEKEKAAKIVEKNEQQAKEAALIEKECDIIERDCSVLVKRNKAMMVRLRRKLIETEVKRRELMKKFNN